MLLKEKVAIVTGSRRGIGYGTVLALAKEGCTVVVSDVDQKDCEKIVAEVEGTGGKGFALKCDVSNKSEVDHLVAETMKKFGKLDILVNNAGIMPFGPFLDLTEESWDQVMNVNIKSVFLCSQAAAKVMKPGSKIVNIASIAAVIGFPAMTHYCASKGAVMSMTRALALELAPNKINVNAIAPGAIDTPAMRQAATDEEVEQTVAFIPCGRIGTPADIANAVVFLASDKSDFIMGQTLIVDGGWTIQ
jgi:3-oxoacyl-[acyl-carrier protein] reductase